MSTACTYVYHDRAFGDVITLCFFQRTPRSFLKEKIVFGVNQGFDCFFYILKLYKELVRELHVKSKLRYGKIWVSLSHSAEINSSHPQFLVLSLQFVTTDVLFICWRSDLRPREATGQLLAAQPFNWNQWVSMSDPIKYHITLFWKKTPPSKFLVVDAPN